MKIIIYLGHPAQYHFFKNFTKIIRKKGVEVTFLIRSKDILEKLLINDSEKFTNIQDGNRGSTKLSILSSLIMRDFQLCKFVREIRPNLLLGTDPSLAHIGNLFNIPIITTLEDDYSIIKNLARLTFPFTSHIFTPRVCDVGRWENKKIGYDGYMKLGYLHPNYFRPDKKIIDKYKLTKNYVIIRLAKLTSHHDVGIKGIDYDILEKLISIVESKSMQVYISSEDTLDDKYTQYLLKINPKDMHHVLSFASLLICDSQSMSVEAAMLGVPSLRYSSFSGRISVLEELEHHYGLTYGINPEHPEGLISKLEELLNMRNLGVEFQARKVKMLTDKIDVTAFLVWFIENYPKSTKIIKENSDYQYKFR